MEDDYFPTDEELRSTFAQIEAQIWQLAHLFGDGDPLVQRGRAELANAEYGYDRGMFKHPLPDHEWLRAHFEETNALCVEIEQRPFANQFVQDLINQIAELEEQEEQGSEAWLTLSFAMFHLSCLLNLIEEKELPPPVARSAENVRLLEEIKRIVHELFGPHEGRAPSASEKIEKGKELDRKTEALLDTAFAGGGPGSFEEWLHRGNPHSPQAR